MRPIKNKDLHGNAPGQSDTALIIIDAINDFDFEGGEKLFPKARSVTKEISHLVHHVRRLKIPIIYANDNRGKWRSDFQRLVLECSRTDKGRKIIQHLRPSEEDYIVLKPKQSAFYATTLDVVLTYLGTRHVILVGWTADNCILFTANDAHMRDYKISIPHDCITSIAGERLRSAIRHFKIVLKADTSAASKLLNKLKKKRSLRERV